MGYSSSIRQIASITDHHLAEGQHRSAIIKSTSSHHHLTKYRHNRLIIVYCLIGFIVLKLHNSIVAGDRPPNTDRNSITITKTNHPNINTLPLLHNMMINRTATTKTNSVFSDTNMSFHNNNSNNEQNDVDNDQDHHEKDIENDRLIMVMNESQQQQHHHQQQQHRRTFTVDDVNKLKQIVMQGLNLKIIPDMLRVNISHDEYREKYNMYLDRVRRQDEREINFNSNMDLLHEMDFSTKLFTFSNTSYTQNFHRQRRRKRTAVDQNNNDLVYIRFDLPPDDLPTDIEESTLRLMIKSHRDAHDHSQSTTEHRSVSVKVYQLIEPYGRILLDQRSTQLDRTHPASHWIEFDVSKAIDSWQSGDSNLGFEIYCDGCDANGLHIVHDMSSYADLPELSPVLNVIGKIIHREKRSRQHRHFLPNSKRKPRKTDCHKENQKCCRHTMDVVFKEIKGFEFIIQPKNFDAGYCRGKCPPRYNPAHHHAVLQSLIWKQDRNKAPRPCCAPSKLVELEVLHVDESDSSKLKVSTWSDMRVLECACS